MQKLSEFRFFKKAKQYVSIILMLFKIVILFVALVNPAMAYQMGVVLQIMQLMVTIAEFLIAGDFLSRRTLR
jgi:hypothetical protein